MEFASTTIPVLERIDVIEEAELPFAEITQPTPEDLIRRARPTGLALDIVRCEIYELVEAGMTDISVRTDPVRADPPQDLRQHPRR